MAQSKSSDAVYSLPDQPQYNPVIRALKTSDPANAETVFNPLFSQIIENIHAVKLLNDEKAKKPTSFNISLPVTKWAVNSSLFQQTVSMNGIISNDKEESLLLITPIGGVEEAGNCEVSAISLQTNTIVFSATAKPTVELYFLVINMGVAAK